MDETLGKFCPTIAKIQQKKGSSGTSNSSIVNAKACSNGGVDKLCSTRANVCDNSVFTFNFDIMNVGKGDNKSEDENEIGKMNLNNAMIKEFAFFRVSGGTKQAAKAVF